MSRILAGFCLSIVCGAGVLIAAEHKELKNYPAAKEGMDRHVINLPKKKQGQEKNLKVEIVPGKVMVADPARPPRLPCSLKRQFVKMGGLPYYDVTGSVMGIITGGTRVHPGKKQEVFVGGQPLLINYDSRHPIVVYAPAGCEIHYRIWTAPQTWESSEKK